MNEREVAGRITRLLDAGARDIDELTLARLKAARLRALERAAVRQPAHSLVTAGSGRGGHAGGHRSWVWAPLVALLFAAAAVGFWQSVDHDGDDIDVFLLSEDLPIRAYMDQDFDAWLKSSSR